MNIVLFSIVVPVYNVEKYLPQCIESLLAQTFTDYEIILVNDGSPDACPRICDDYASKYSQVKVVHKPNGGLSDARNKGVEVASGRYITFVDSDDFWVGSDVLSNVASIIDKFNPDIVVSDFIKYYTDGDKYIYPTVTCDQSYNDKTKIEVLKYLYFSHADLKMSACQKFAKSELLTCNSFTKGLISEDIDWSLKIYPSAQSICVYGKPYYCYRQFRAGSITNGANLRRIDALLTIIAKWETTIPEMTVSSIEKEIYSGYLAYQLSIAMALYPSLNAEDKKDAIQRIAAHSHLFNGLMNTKTKKVKTLVSILGLKSTCRILDYFLRIRGLIHSS